MIFLHVDRNVLILCRYITCIGARVMISNVIRKRPWAILLAWIIIVALLANYAMQINDVVLTETESFLPENVESIKAEKKLTELTEEYGVSSNMGADYLIAIQGVPVSLETYYKLKDPYMNLYNNTNESLLSWINIVYDVEENIRQGMYQAINGTLYAINGTLTVNEAYNQTRQGLEGATNLIIGIDQGYSQIYQATMTLTDQVEQINGSITLYLTACNDLLPALAYTTADIVRVEAILENKTQAYQTLNLTPADIQTVIEYTNISTYGINPVPPELVQAVYGYVLSIGGPGNFTNNIALSLATQLVLQTLQQQLPPEQLQAIMPVYNMTAELLGQQLVSIPDLRMTIIQAPDPYTGQLMVFQIITNMQDDIKPQLLGNITQFLQMQLPPEQAQLAELINATVQAYNCSTQQQEQILFTVLRQLLISQGLPDSPLTTQLVNEIISGHINKTTLMSIVLLSVQEQLANQTNSGSFTGINITQMISQVSNIILQEDPEGKGIFVNPVNATLLASKLLLVSMNITITQEYLQWLSTNVTDLNEQAYAVLYITTLEKYGRNATLTVRALYDRGLLGANESILLKAMPNILASQIAEKANISSEDAREIVESAVKVYAGESTLDNEVNNLTRINLEKAFDKIIDEIKGLLIQKDLNGFLVSYLPPDEENVSVDEFKHVSQELESLLKEQGYSPTLHLGGTMYMEYEIRQGALQDIQRSDRISMILVLIILALVLESIAAVLLPFVGIGFGLILGLAAAVFLSKAGIIDVTTHSRTIMYTTGLGLGIDYAAYVSKRFREAYAKYENSREAAVEAFQKSWKPVLAGALTAAIGFGSMLLGGSDFPFLSSIGGNVPLAILGVMVASITFIPALLAYVGGRDWFWWPRHPLETKHNESKTARLLFPLVRNKIVPLAIIVLLAVGAYAVMSGFTGSYDMSLNLPANSETAKTNDIINTYYDPGVLYPMYVILSDPAKAEELNNTLKDYTCISKIVIPEEYHGKVVRIYFSINPLSYDGIQCTEQIRDDIHKVDPQALVGGMSAVNLDLRNLINHIFYHKVYPIAITLMFLTMLAAYGGILTALSAILSVILAAYTASALTVYIYTNIIGLDVLWYLPVIVFTAILGVGMDYNSFYIARVREECEKECSENAVRESLAHATPIVLGLATIMAGAYIGLASTSTPGLAEMGAALVLGVLLAGFYASVLLTPPLVLLLKDKAWWPRKIKR